MLLLYRQDGDRLGEAITLGRLGNCHKHLGDFDRARAISESLDLKMELSRDLGNLALCHRSLGELDEAQRSFDRALALALAQETETPLQAAEASRLLADSFMIGGEPLRSLELYDAADALMAGIADPDISWRIEFGRAKALLLVDREEEALAELLAETALIEDVRSRLREARFRAGYLQDKSDVYEALVRLLLKLGRVAEAFEAAERLRAQSYLESLETAFPVTRTTADRGSWRL